MLKGKTFLISGASSGIGLNLANYLASLNANLIMLANNRKKLQQAAEIIKDKYAIEATLCPFNLANSTADDYIALKDELSSQLNSLDGLIHCAGILNQLTPLEQMSMSQWQQTIQINLNARFLLTQTCLPLLRKSKKSKLIFILSELSQSNGQANWGAYQVADTGAKVLAEIFQQELAHTSIKTQSFILPPVQTPLRKKVYPFEDQNSLLATEQLSSKWNDIFIEISKSPA